MSLIKNLLIIIAVGILAVEVSSVAGIYDVPRPSHIISNLFESDLGLNVNEFRVDNQVFSDVPVGDSSRGIDGIISLSQFPEKDSGYTGPLAFTFNTEVDCPFTGYARVVLEANTYIVGVGSGIDNLVINEMILDEPGEILLGDELTFSITYSVLDVANVLAGTTVEQLFLILYDIDGVEAYSVVLELVT